MDNKFYIGFGTFADFVKATAPQFPVYFGVSQSTTQRQAGFIEIARSVSVFQPLENSVHYLTMEFGFYASMDGGKTCTDPRKADRFLRDSKQVESVVGAVLNTKFFYNGVIGGAYMSHPKDLLIMGGVFEFMTLDADSNWVMGKNFNLNGSPKVKNDTASAEKVS